MAGNRKANSFDYRNVLVFSFSHIGDAVMSTAVIQPLRNAFQNARITYLVGPRAYSVLKDDKMIDAVVVYDKERAHSGLSGKVKLVSDLRKRKFELVIDLRDSFWSRIIGAKRWGFPLGRDKNTHAVDRYLEILQKHGVAIKGAKPTLSLSDTEVDEAKSFLKENEISKFPLIAIHPGGDWAYKLWTVNNFAKAADILSQKFGAQILIFAGEEEHSIQNKMVDLMSHKAVVVAGRNLRMVTALVEQCDIYIGNDTGPTHIASAVETPAVAIFGPTDDRRSGPYGDKNIVVRSGLKLDCSPCHPGRKPGRCGKVPCEAIEAISVKQIVEAAIRLLHLYS